VIADVVVIVAVAIAAGSLVGLAAVALLRRRRRIERTRWNQQFIESNRQGFDYSGINVYVDEEGTIRWERKN
jgi:hypothetical protein